jgi:hypothetical protein
MNASQRPGAAERITFPEQRTVLEDGTVYTPFLAEGRPGLQCTRPGSSSQYIYFNPSDHTDGDVPNVFVYQGTEGDPCADTPIHHYCIWPELGPIADDAPSPRRFRRALTRMRRVGRP